MPRLQHISKYFNRQNGSGRANAWGEKTKKDQYLIDFTTVEVVDPASLRLETFYVLFAIHLSIREVKQCGITRCPKEDMLSFKSEALGLVIPQSEEHLRETISVWMKYYNTERNTLKGTCHQGIEEMIIRPGKDVGVLNGDIVCRTRLGKSLRYYFREAA